MDLSILIAKMLGIVYIAVGLGFLFKTLDYKKIYEGFVDNSALLYMTGIMITIASFFLINYHNIWEPGWRVIITVIAWMAFIKGIFLLTMPDNLKYFRGMTEGKFATIVPYFAIILGGIFAYFGFFHTTM